MIYTRLNGGLGNQLFQYAAGFALSKKRQTGLTLDCRIYDKQGLRAFELGHFNISAACGDAGTLPPDQKSPLRYLIWRYMARDPKICREKSLGFNEVFLSLPDESYLHGYWQTEKYFASCEADLRREFSFKNAPSGRNAELLEQIRNGHSVSLHVRRGDYVTQAGSATHGTCNKQYYTQAVDVMAEKLGRDFTVFIFSDDPEWAHANLALRHKTIVVDINDASTGYEDLRLMSACSHHIIANSSFSWWGAWLNPKPDKIVIAPERWYANPALKNPDICPASWLRVSGN